MCYVIGICAIICFVTSCTQRIEQGQYLISSELPDGRKLTPAGSSTAIDGIPQIIAMHPGGEYAAVLSWEKQGNRVTIIDAFTKTKKQTIQLNIPATSMCFSPDGTHLFIANGSSGLIDIYTCLNDTIKYLSSLSLTASKDKNVYPALIAITRDGEQLIAVYWTTGAGYLYLLNRKKSIWESIPLGKVDTGIPFPAAIAVHPDNQRIFIGGWGAECIAVIHKTRTSSGKTPYVTRIQTPSESGALVLSPDGNTLYAAHSECDTISIIDTRTYQVTGYIDLHPFPNAPPGIQPSALAVSHDGKILYVACAGINAIAVVSFAEHPAVVKGLIPSGRFPIAVNLLPSESVLMTANGKITTVETDTTAAGTVSFIPVPNTQKLSVYTKQTSLNNHFAEAQNAIDYGNNFREPKPVPEKLGEASLIQNVFYIITDNITHRNENPDAYQPNSYPGGMDSHKSSDLFPPDSMPNYHSLVAQFALCKNVYSPGETETLGLVWATAGKTPLIMEILAGGDHSTRPFYKSNKPYDTRNLPAIWDSAQKMGITTKIYGLNLDEEVLPLKHSAAIISEFKSASGGKDSLPQLTVIHLPIDTAGKSPLKALKELDSAVGELVDWISHSYVWGKSLIVIIEMPPDGKRHTTVYHSFALLVSPFVRRGFVDDQPSSTLNLLRTIGLIFSIPPLSLIEAQAAPVTKPFRNVANVNPYSAIRNR